MNKKIKIVVLLLCAVSALYIMFAFIYQVKYGKKDKRIDKVNISGSYKECNDDEWIYFGGLQNIKSDSFEQIIIKGRLDRNVPKNAIMYNFIAGTSVKVYKNENLIYESEISQFLHWEEIKSPGITTEDEIIIIIDPINDKYYDGAYRIYLDNLYFGDKEALVSLKLTKNIGIIVGSFIVFLIGFAIFVAHYIFHTFDIKDTKIYLPCSILLIAGGIISFIKQEYITLVVREYVFINAIEFILKMLFVGMLFIYLDKFITQKAGKVISQAVLAVWFVIFFLCFMRRALYVYEQVNSTDAVIIIITILLLIYEINLAVDYLRDKKEKPVYVIVSAFVIISITVMETFYYIIKRRFAALLFLGMLLLFAIINFMYMVKQVKKNIHKAQLAQQLENELLNSKLELMASQMKPHFVFNALGIIRELCTQDEKKAQQAIDYFSTYLKSNINAIDENKCIAFKKELKHCESFLYIEQLRKEDRLKVVYDIQETNFYIPPLCIETLVENAVKHGIGKREEGGTVTIRTCKNNNSYIVEVWDDGVGFDIYADNTKDDGRKHIGFENTRKRIKNLCEGDIFIESRLNEGTKVKIVLPDKK